MSARSRAFPWWGERRAPRVELQKPERGIDWPTGTVLRWIRPKFNSTIRSLVPFAVDPAMPRNEVRFLDPDGMEFCRITNLEPPR